MPPGAEPAPKTAESHISVTVNDALAGSGDSCCQAPGPPHSSNEFSKPQVMGATPATPKAHTVVQGRASGRNQLSHDGGSFHVADAAAAPGPPVGTVAKRVLLLLLQLVLLGGYALLCAYMAIGIIASSSTVAEFNDGLPQARWRFVNASAVLVGIIGTIVAGLCFLWGVATAVWPHKLPRPAWMRYTLGTAPALVHGVLVLMPFTVAVFETHHLYRTNRERKLLL